MTDSHRIHHDWHTFDERLGYEVRRDGDSIDIRWLRDDDSYNQVSLDLAEFNQLRGTGPKPRGLQ